MVGSSRGCQCKSFDPDEMLGDQDPGPQEVANPAKFEVSHQIENISTTNKFWRPIIYDIMIS